MPKLLIALKYCSDDVNDNFEHLKPGKKLRVGELIGNIQTWVQGQEFLELTIKIYMCCRSSCNDSLSRSESDLEIIVVECKTLRPVANPEV